MTPPPPPTSLPVFLAQHFGPLRFAIYPYLPLNGCITFLYGKTGLGKSPLTWEMARCVASGTPFFHCQTTKGRVLYIDLDTPPAFIHARLALLESAPEDFYIECSEACNLLQAPAQQYFRGLQADVKPIVVIINTLRKLYSADEKDASMPSRIYAILRNIFSPAGILLVHHDRKSVRKKDELGDPREDFSGHMAWLNDCQVGLHLTPGGGGVPGLLTLYHSKSQVSEQAPPFLLQLGKDGTALVDYKGQKAAAVMSAFVKLPVEMTKTDKVKLISQQLTMSQRSVWTYLSYLSDPILQQSSS